MNSIIPQINDLPMPAPGKTGWPWTQQSNVLYRQTLVGSAWPKISIVTSNYNYGEFLEETIRSVLLQGYPNLEYIVIDGGSTDNSIEIIQRYEKYLTYWVSKPDKGQTDAINQGYEKCTGNIFSWLNSDDTYTEGVLWKVAEYFRNQYQIIAGGCRNLYIDAGYEEIIHSPKWGFKRYLRFWSYPSDTFFPQPSVFLAKEVSDKCFPLDYSLYCAMDQQYFLRALIQKPQRINVEEIWVNMKYHGKNKTGSNYPVFDELCRVSLTESKKLPFLDKKLFEWDLSNYIKIRSLLSLEEKLKLKDFLRLISTSPSILRLVLFWKIFIKNMISKNIYAFLKKIMLSKRL